MARWSFLDSWVGLRRPEGKWGASLWRREAPRPIIIGGKFGRIQKIGIQP
jgi:hypothetical protein